MGYDTCLEMAGATVHAYEEFGSYDGDWHALVTYKDNTGWVSGWYGSCPGCDALEAEGANAELGESYLDDIRPFATLDSKEFGNVVYEWMRSEQKNLEEENHAA